ncbi:MAG TPA: hypothetical protein V6C84_00100 [Coleofasciculaceae cyanobacterium]|jgi:hypothetical protein
MQKIDTTSFPVLDPAKRDWDFVEIWIDPILFPPYILMMLSDSAGCCHVYDPAEGYKIVFSSVTYSEAQNWLLEDEYEPIEGRLAASDL